MQQVYIAMNVEV